MVCCLLLLTTAGCKFSEPEADEARADVHTWLPLKIDAIALEAQLAITQGEMSRGLMHRDSLPENGGMLFLYRAPQQVAFWMANTRIPLDIGFFDSSGVLLEVYRMVPFDTQRTVSRSDQVRFALEMNSGWFSANGLRPGAQMDLDLLQTAIRQRGAVPAHYGL